MTFNPPTTLCVRSITKLYNNNCNILAGERSLRAAAETKNKNLMPPCSRSRSTRSIACLIYTPRDFIVIIDGWNRSRSFDLILIIRVTAADSVIPMPMQYP